MSSTIVIGSDGSAQSDSALQFGGAVARALGARVVVTSAYVHTPPSRGDGGAFARIQRADTAEIARAGAASLKGISDVQARTSAGSTLGAALHGVAEDERADVLVIATSARPRIGGFQPGSVSEQVVHHSPCPVAVVPPLAGEPRLHQIGVAVDGTPASRAALDFALELAQRAGERSPVFHLLYVAPSEHVPQPGTSAAVPARVFARQRLDELAVELAAHGEVEVHEQMGEPAKELVRMSEGLDVLVTGSRNQGAIKRLLLGSVSTHVVRNATCPVIVVPAATGRGAFTDVAAHADPATA
jgi:nucleotide-binding universal stress UspA family protein